MVFSPSIRMGFVDYQNCRLHYNRIGTGKQILLLFHGFGQHHKAFDLLTENLAHTHTLFAFDLFFHGESQWPDERPLEKEIWKDIMAQFFGQNNIDRFSVLGFSMGGKFALATVELFPDLVSRLILLAPDGIKTSFWYSLATYPIALRSWFKSMILKPGRLQGLLIFLRTLRLVDAGLLRFAEFQMNTQEKRERVYYSWVVFRHLKFDLKKIAQLILEHRIPFTLLIGRYDKIITSQNMNRILRYLPDVKVTLVESGHNRIIETSIPALHQLLLSEL